MEGIGDRIRQAREDRGIRQVDLAAKLGWDKRELSAIENSTRRNIGAERLKAVAQELGVTSDSLLGLPAPPKPRRATRAPRPSRKS